MKKIAKSTAISENLVKNPLKENENKNLKFVFNYFKASPINIDGVFNNHYKNEDEYIRKITILISKALPLLSGESSNLFKDIALMKKLHIHKISGKNEILRQIFSIYGYAEENINNIFEGEQLYQFEVPYENGAFRVAFELIGECTLSFLFLDPNHHIYMNKTIIDGNGSMFYDYCPIYQSNSCNIMNYLQTCFAFEYFDSDKFDASFEYDYSPQDN